MSRGARIRWPSVDVTGDVTGAIRKRWPARRDQASIVLPIPSPVPEALGPGPIYLTPKDWLQLRGAANVTVVESTDLG